MQSFDDEDGDEWFEDGPRDDQHRMCTGLLTQEIQFLDGAFTQKYESGLTVNLKQYSHRPTFSASSHSSDTEDDGIIEADKAQSFGPLPDLPMSTMSTQNIINENNIFTQCSQIILSPPDSFQSTQKPSTNLVSDKLLNQFSDRHNSALDLLLNAKINSNVTHMLDLNKSGSSSCSWEKNSTPNIGKYEDAQIPSQQSVPASPCLSEQYEALAYFNSNKSAENSNEKTISQLSQEKKIFNESSLVKSPAQSSEILITINQSGVSSINENAAITTNQTMSKLNDKLSKESSTKQDEHLDKDQDGSNMGASSCSWEENVSPNIGKHEDIQRTSQQSVPASPCLSEQYEGLAYFNSNQSAENSNDKTISQLSQEKKILNEDSLVKIPAYTTEILITNSQSSVTSMNENAAMMINQTMPNLNDKLSQESSSKEDEDLDMDQDDSNITEPIQPESPQKNIEQSHVCFKKTEKELMFIHTAVQTDISSIGTEDCVYLFSKKRELDALYLEGPKRFKVKSLPLVLSDIGPNAFYATLTEKNDHENLAILNKNCNVQGHGYTSKNMDQKSRSIRLGLPRTVKTRLHKMKSKHQLLSYS